MIISNLLDVYLHSASQVDATDCHFAYRMIMVLLRRELSLDQVCRFAYTLFLHDSMISSHVLTDLHVELLCITMVRL